MPFHSPDFARKLPLIEAFFAQCGISEADMLFEATT